MTRRVLSALALFTLVGCSKTPEPAPEKSSTTTTTPTPAATTSAATTESAPADIGYDVPKSWQSMPNTSSMRKATFKVPKADGDTEDGDLAVSQAGGSMDANIGRWASQFGLSEPTKKEERKVNGLPVTIVELKGKYAGMGGAPPKDNYMMLGAIVPGAQHQLHFFKLTGPEKTVTAAKKDFDAFVSSFHAK